MNTIVGMSLLDQCRVKHVVEVIVVPKVCMATRKVLKWKLLLTWYNANKHMYVPMYMHMHLSKRMHLHNYSNAKNILRTSCMHVYMASGPDGGRKFSLGRLRKNGEKKRLQERQNTLEDPIRIAKRLVVVFLWGYIR